MDSNLEPKTIEPRRLLSLLLDSNLEPKTIEPRRLLSLVLDSNLEPKTIEPRRLLSLVLTPRSRAGCVYGWTTQLLVYLVLRGTCVFIYVWFHY